VSPYRIKEDDFRLSYRINSVHYSKGLSITNALDVVFSAKKDEDVNVFKLAGLYAKHTDYVAELIYKAKLKYSPHYRDHLVKCYKSLDLTESEISRMIIL